MNRKKLLVLILAYLGSVVVFTLIHYYSDQQQPFINALILGLILALGIFIVPIWRKFSNTNVNINVK